MAARKTPAKKAPARKAPAKKAPTAKKAPAKRPAPRPSPAVVLADEPKSLTTEVGSGDERRALVAMRDHLALKMESAEPAVVAQIAGRLQAVITRLGELAEPDAASAADQLAARRVQRRAKG